MNFLDGTSQEVRFAADLVADCARLAHEIQQELVHAALEKRDRSPVTVADFALQAVVGHRLSQSFPEIPLVAEEAAEALKGPESAEMVRAIAEFVSRLEQGVEATNVLQWIDRGASDLTSRFWVLDPIDGTKGFLRNAQYAVALALVEAGQVQLGVIGCPRLSESALLGKDLEFKPSSMGSMVVAARGQGTWVGDLDLSRFTQVRVSSCTQPENAVVLRSLESGHTNVEQLGKLNRKLGILREPVQLDSMAKYALLASGRGELLLRLISPSNRGYREKIWDHAAGLLAVEEAGGRVTDLAGRDLDLTAGRKLENNRGIIASNGHLHDIVLRTLTSPDAT